MIDRYARQRILDQVGDAGQALLAEARVAVVGAGGLGCPALQYLVGAGVGHITIIDHDTIERTNLHRQPLYGESQLGRPKAEAACERLADLNPDVTLEPRVSALQPDLARQLAGDHDVVLDCADSFAVSYSLSDACLEQQTPFVAAAALGLTGYAGGFCAGAPSLRAVFPDLPATLATCATAGVLGPVVGMLGALQAQMTLAVVLRSPPSPLGQLVSFADGRFGGFRFDGAPEPDTDVWRFVSHADLSDADRIIELRDATEAPEPAHPAAIRMSPEAIANGPFSSASGASGASGTRTVFCCRSGLRAWRAASVASKQYPGPFALYAAGP